MSAKAKNKLTPQQRKATLNRVLHKIRPYSAFVVCSLLVAAVSVAAQLYIPILCGDAIDKMLGKGNVDLAGVLRIAVSILVVAAVAALAQWLLSVCNNRITFSVSRDLRNEALRKIQTLPLSYLDSHPSGDIVSRMVADVDTFADGLLMGFTQLFSGILTIFGTLLFMLRENVPITLVVVCITPLSLVVAGFLAKRSYGYFQSQSTVRGKQTALVNEMIEGQKVVQAFGHEAESLAAFDEVNGQLQDVSLKAIFFSSLTNPATRFVNNIVYAGVGLVGALYAVRGGITIGQLSVFLNYANQYTKPFNEISGVVTELQNALACAARVFELLDADDQIPEAENASVLQPDGHVQLEDVSFRYLPDRPLTILTGVLGDKDYHCMYRSVADHAAEFITVTPDNPRALTAQELAGYLSSFGKPVTACDTVDEGVRLAIDHAGKSGTVLCYGSLYLLGDVIAAAAEVK